MKVSFINTNFNNISFGLSRGFASKFKKAGSKEPVSDVFVKSTEETGEKKSKRIADKSNIDTIKPWAKSLSNDAEAAFKIFRAKMENVFSPVCNYEKRSHDWLPSEKCQGELVTNKKTMSSIIEKMLSGGKKTEKEARAEIKDAIRARIILKSGSQAEGDAICNEIIKAVKKGKLEIKQIKNYTTDNNMQYVSPKILNKLKRTLDETSGNASYRYRDDKKPTGYNAVHIIFKVDNEFDGELQIMGRNVERLKDVEDVFYKLSGNKHVSKRYKDIEKKYRALEDKNSNKLEETLTAYTQEAYLYERKKELGLVKDIYKGQFLPLDTTKYDLPEEFDFNNIAAIKNSPQ